MDVAFRDNVYLARVEMVVDGRVAGFVEYELSHDRIELNHTEVFDEYAGQGLARTLVAHVLEGARVRGLTVRPHCSYVAAYLRDHLAEWLDLIAESDRPAFGV